MFTYSFNLIIQWYKNFYANANYGLNILKTKAKCEYDGEEQDEGMEGGWVHTQPDLRYYKLRSGSVQYKKQLLSLLKSHTVWFGRICSRCDGHVKQVTHMHLTYSVTCKARLARHISSKSDPTRLHET